MDCKYDLNESKCRTCIKRNNIKWVFTLNQIPSDVQFEGKKKMPVSEYIKGNTIEKGVILGGVN